MRRLCPPSLVLVHCLFSFACGDHGPTGKDPSQDSVGDSEDSADSGDPLDPCAPPPLSTAVAPGIWPWGDVTLDDAGASLLGRVPGDLAGSALLVPGDVDGDGFADLLIGVSGASDLAGQGGRVQVVWGRETGWSLAEDLAPYPSFAGEHERLRLSRAVSLGDLDGDCLADFALDPDEAAASIPPQLYVLRGRSRDDLASVTPASEAGTLIRGEGVLALSTRGPLGDLDGDGLDDVLLWSVERLYALSGATLEAETLLPKAAIFRSWPDGPRDTPRPRVGGDLDGDGLADLLFEITLDTGSPDARYVSHVVLGGSALPVDLPIGEAADVSFLVEDDQHLHIDPVGDLDGDGRGDLFLTVSFADDASTRGGYVFLGRPSWASSLTLGEADFRVGPGAHVVPNPAGDLDGDGIDDLVVAVMDETDATWSLHLFPGRASWPSTLELTDRAARLCVGDGRALLRANGEVGLGGDFDGDGIQDLFVVCGDCDMLVEDGGLVAIFHGRTPWPPEMTEADADLRVRGATRGERVGSEDRVVLGDLNHDGRDDLVLSRLSDTPDGDSEVFLFFGRPRD